MAKTLTETRMKLLFGLWLLLTALHLMSQLLLQLSDGWVWLSTFALSVPVTALLFWRRRIHRRAFLDLYLNPLSCWHQWLKGGLFMLLMRGVVAYLLTLLLLIGLVRVNQITLWMFLVILVPLWVFSYNWFFTYVARHASVRFRRLVTDRVHGITHACLLVLALSIWALYEPRPDLSGVSLESAVLELTSAPDIESNTLRYGLILTGALNAVPMWLAQNFGQQLPSVVWRLIVWMFLLLRDWLFVWPLILVFQGLHAFLDGGLSDRLKESSYDDGTDSRFKR
jgi:hypothetical protein